MQCKKGKEPQKLTPDMAGYRPVKEWWPDLTGYHKAIMLHNISADNVETLLEQYSNLYGDVKKVACEFAYAALPGDPSWVCLEVPDCAGVAHHQLFWTYQNLMVWLSQRSDREFCLATPRKPALPLLLSTRDTKNPRGDSCVGLYADRDFYFEIPGSLFEWGPVPTSGFDYAGYLKAAFAFDTQWLPGFRQAPTKRLQLTLAFSDD